MDRVIANKTVDLEALSVLMSIDKIVGATPSFFLVYGKFGYRNVALLFISVFTGLYLI